MTGILPHEEVAQGLALLDALQVIERIGILSAANVVVVLTDILRVTEVQELIAHCGSHKVDVVTKGRSVHCPEVQVELKTCILHRSHVDKGLVKQVRRNRYLVVTEQILLAAAEVVERTVQAVIKQGEVKANVPVLALLPLEVGIHILGGSPNLEVLAIVEIVAKACHCVERQIATEVLVARHTEVSTQLQVVDPCDVLHEVLGRNAPTGRNGGEVTPLVVDTKL